MKFGKRRTVIWINRIYPIIGLCVVLFMLCISAVLQYGYMVFDVGSYGVGYFELLPITTCVVLILFIGSAMIRERRRERENIKKRIETENRRETVLMERGAGGWWEWREGDDHVDMTASLRKALDIDPEVKITWNYLRNHLNPDGYASWVSIAKLLSVDGDKGAFKATFFMDSKRMKVVRSVYICQMVDGRRVYQGIMYDITELAEYLNRLEKYRELAERERSERIRYISGISNELRQPTQAIMLHLATLRKSVAAGHLFPIIEGLEDTAASIGDMLNVLIEMAKLDQGKVSMRREPVDVGSLIKRLALEYRRRANDVDIELRFVPTDIVIESDPVIVERIYRILIDNAIRYTSSGGIIIGCRRKHRGTQAALFVSDTGRGFRGMSTDSVFEAFHAKDDENLSGMNVSLALAKRLADSLSHTLICKSRDGRGSTFSLVLPISKVAKKSGKNIVNDDEFEARSLLIALVEGDAVIRNAITQAAERWGHDVVSSSNSRDLCDVLNGRVPDVVISEHHIEGIEDGLDAIEYIRSESGWPVPGIILADDTLGPRYSHLESQGITLLHKPIRPQKLKRTIESVASQALWAA